METSNPTRQLFAQKLPCCLAYALTQLTGVIEEGQILPRRSKRGRVARAFGTFAAGLIVGVISIPVGGEAGIVGLPIGVAITIAGARDLQLTILHHCAHGNVFSPASDRLLGRVIASLLMIERFEVYAPKHAVAHHGRHTLSTEDDDTLNFLRGVIGITPGASIKQNGYRFIVGLISPLVHGTMLYRRLHSQFVAGSWANRVVAAAYLAIVAGLAVVTGWWLPLALGWALPLTVGYQIAQCMRFVVEHHWPAEPTSGRRRSEAEHDQLTVAVRCAVPPPAYWTPASVLAWSGEMAFNVMIRCLVLPGDSGPSHHWHHSKARGDWANHIAEASAWEHQRLAAGLLPSREAWGYREAFRLVLESFAAAKPEALVSSLPTTSRLVTVG